MPGTQRKLFSNFRWCLDGRVSLGHFMKYLRLGSDVTTLRNQHVPRKLEEQQPKRPGQALQSLGAPPIPLSSAMASASHGPCWALQHLPKASLSLLTREWSEQAPPHAAEGRPQGRPCSQGVSCKVAWLCLQDSPNPRVLEGGRDGHCPPFPPSWRTRVPPVCLLTCAFSQAAFFFSLLTNNHHFI